MSRASEQTPYVLVRIKTYNRGLGHVARRYTVQGFRFDIDQGWKKVGRGIAAEIGKERHPSTGAEIFDIVELHEAQEMAEAEAHEPWAQGQLAPERAGAVKIKDFKRREEIKAAKELLEGKGDDGWDDESPQRSATRATSAPPAESKEPSVKSITKKTSVSKKRVKRRSASK